MLLLLFRSPQLGSPGYVFYESNVYESRVYKPDGNVETSRRESFKTNLQSQNALDIQRKVEADFNAMDMEMNRELEAMTRLQQAMLEGMFR